MARWSRLGRIALPAALTLILGCGDDIGGPAPKDAQVADATPLVAETGVEAPDLGLAPDVADATVDARPSGTDVGPLIPEVGADALEAGAVALEAGVEAPVDAEGVDGRPAAVDTAPPGPDFFTIAVLPDTQYSYYYSPSFFDAETTWIAANAAAEKIAFVLHEGDIVDSPLDTSQWAAARAAMGRLDGKVPYVLAAGNHDLALAGKPDAPRTTLLNDTFNYDDIAGRPGFGGAYQPGHLEDAYYLLPAGGQTWLVLSLEFSPRPEVLAWASQVLDAHPTLPAIVLTHAYLYSDGTRYDHSVPGRTCPMGGTVCTDMTPGANSQCWNPLCYLGDGSDGEMIWKAVGLPHGNVRFVFSGHVANPAPYDAARLTTTRFDGTVCHQMLADFQADGATGGDGYFRLLRVWSDGRVEVRTFSPYVTPALANWTDDRNQFTLRIP
jgi:hypothetical protein